MARGAKKRARAQARARIVAIMARYAARQRLCAYSKRLAYYALRKQKDMLALLMRATVMAPRQKHTAIRARARARQP